MPPKTCCFPEVVILCIRTKGKEEKREITEKCNFKINTENKTEVTKKTHHPKTPPNPQPNFFSTPLPEDSFLLKVVPLIDIFSLYELVEVLSICLFSLILIILIPYFLPQPIIFQLIARVKIRNW